MKIYISYFYQIRFFSKNMIPLSTAVWDPKWFQPKDGQRFFKDKNGVYNGLRIAPLEPQEGGCPCAQGKNPPECAFMRNYEAQLKTLDFQKLLGYFEKVGKRVQELEGFVEDPIIVLIVYETPDNPCSERIILKKWFHENGYELEEWSY